MVAGGNLIPVTREDGPGREIETGIVLVASKTGDWERDLLTPGYETLKTKTRTGNELITWTKPLDGSIAIGVGNISNKRYRAMVADLDSLIIQKDRQACTRRTPSAPRTDCFGMAKYAMRS